MIHDRGVVILYPFFMGVAAQRVINDKPSSRLRVAANVFFQNVQGSEAFDRILVLIQHQETTLAIEKDFCFASIRIRDRKQPLFIGRFQFQRWNAPLNALGGAIRIG